MAELLYRTNMVALVGSGSNPKYPVNTIHIWDDSKLAIVGELSFKSIIRGMKMVKDK
jgi:WD repeat-containing protein 45